MMHARRFAPLTAAVLTAAALAAAGCETAIEGFEVAGNRSAGPFVVKVVDAGTGAPIVGARVAYRYFFADPVLGTLEETATLRTDDNGRAAVSREDNAPAKGEPRGMTPSARNFIRITFRVSAEGHVPDAKTIGREFFTSLGGVVVVLEPMALEAPVTGPMEGQTPTPLPEEGSNAEITSPPDQDEP